MAAAEPFNRGDKVVHPKRPEWGTGTVRSGLAVKQPDGKRAQKLTIDFPNRGRVVINTAVVTLTAASEARPVAATASSPRVTPSLGTPPLPRNPTMSRSSQSTSLASDSGWLNDLEGQTSELWAMPDALVDPFASLGQRLKATLETYRYSTEPRSLFDWAVRQTGLDDPLSKYNRHELEQGFQRFARDRDQHLRDIVRQMKRNDGHHEIKAAGRGLFPAGQSALDRAMRA